MLSGAEEHGKNTIKQQALTSAIKIQFATPSGAEEHTTNTITTSADKRITLQFVMLSGAEERTTNTIKQQALTSAINTVCYIHIVWCRALKSAVKIL